jgi:hypothetical protein
MSNAMDRVLDLATQKTAARVHPPYAIPRGLTAFLIDTPAIRIVPNSPRINARVVSNRHSLEGRQKQILPSESSPYIRQRKILLQSASNSGFKLA